jgi:uncharacterized membrane protein YhaH (DUF805 family)
MATFLLLVITLLIVFLLTVLIEAVVMQLLRWGDFKQSSLASLGMNLASILAWLIMVALVQEIGIIGILVAMLLSFLIEGGVLARLRPGQLKYNFLVAFAANLASYLILLLPAFWFSRGS